MTRKPLIAGNWKMNTNGAAACDLASGIVSGAAEVDAELLVCPPFVYLGKVHKIVSGSNVALGAQDVYFEGNGAFTGQISVEMLKDCSCSHVILGHSERRQLMGETDALVNQKLKAALSGGLVPIVCVGETLEERESGETLAVVSRQFEGSLAGVSAEDMMKTVIAYEPVWAIGTGKVATPEQAQEVHADLRKLIEKQYNSDVSAAVRILYGGSVKPDNAADLIGQADIDGALVGGASLKPDSFLAIARACPNH